MLNWSVLMWRYALFFAMLAYSPFAPLLAQASESGKSVTSKGDELRLGERIYREGILPSGKPVEAIVKGDIEVEGSMFSCQSCHMRAGMGSFEGGVYTPPTNGANLFKPLKLVYKGIVQEQVPPRRPAYTDATLAEVLRYGDDPTGRMLNDVMPRYLLEDKDMALLISYLKTLSSKFSPGVTKTTLSFATVITDGVKEEEREAMMGPLEDYVKNKNNLVNYFNTEGGVKSRRMAVAMLGSPEMAFRKLSLSRWFLKGPPESWRAQLDEYYRKEPVFALLGGITTGEWGPVHHFCEDNHIPCLFPNTDYPVISKSDWYTLYMSKGHYQEGEGAARYLNNRKETLKGKGVLQIVRESREGKAMAEGFRETWTGLGHGAPDMVVLDEGRAMSKMMLERLLAEKKPAAIMIWDDAGSLPVLDMLAASKRRPEMVFVSSTYLGKGMRTISERARGMTYITYPYSLPPEPPDPEAPPKMPRKVFKEGSTKIENQTFSIIELLNMALMNVRGNYYRDYFFDIIDCVMDQDVPLYERLSFGPGQRYASKGCYIVQLSKGDKPELLRKSDWVSH